VRELLILSWRELLLVLGSFGTLWQEVVGIQFTGPRARQSSMTVLSTALSVVIALALHMDYVWWAGISGFMSMQATRPGSIQRALLRVGGTFAGACLAILLTPWVAYDHVAGSLLVFAFATLGILGYQVSSHAFAWLFAGITVNLIVMSSLQDPTVAFHYAFYRTAEVAIGSATALVIAFALAPDGGAAPPPPPGWRQLWTRDWPRVLHAIRCGLTVMLLPWVWSWFNQLSLTQMSVTVAVIMAVPVAPGDPLESGRRIASQSLQRVMGCFIGGVAGLLLLALSLTEFLPWLLALSAVLWVGAYIQTSTKGVGYIGTQAVLVLIMTLVQGWGPPDSIMPGIARFLGMMAGLGILMVVSLIFWPEPTKPALPTAAAS
jgi:uncharacterized membrane protein YccC